MKTISVKASKEYQVLIGHGLLARAGEQIRAVAPRAEKAAIVSDDNVAPLYLKTLEESLHSQGLETVSFVFPHGEASKNGNTFLQILSFLAANQVTRSDLVLALGGGVVGDISGFAAASYLRGVKYIQLPTSLLAMVDSSVGGKTAIDLPEGKNLAGAFCQPALVLCDLDCLQTLTPEFFTDGCAEVLKYGVLADRELFAHLQEKGQAFDREYVIARCVERKRDYVCADEFDKGLRQMLNLGHTIGHAIEQRSAYTLSHGRAVAIGMSLMARICAARGLCSEGCREEILQALEALQLPTKTEYGMEELLSPMLSDKKRSGSSLNLIVPRDIGHCEILPVAAEALPDFLKEGF